jgi:hypothetical protein
LRIFGLIEGICQPICGAGRTISGFCIKFGSLRKESRERTLNAAKRNRLFVLPGADSWFPLPLPGFGARLAVIFPPLTLRHGHCFESAGLNPEYLNEKGVEKMKKIITLSLLLGTMFLGASATQAETKGGEASAHAATQIRLQIGQRNRRGVRRVVTTTRVTRVGRQRFRETIRTTYMPNGRTRTEVIRRVRVV